MRSRRGWGTAFLYSAKAAVVCVFCDFDDKPAFFFVFEQVACGMVLRVQGAGRPVAYQVILEPGIGQFRELRIPPECVLV